jgi:DNA-binding CsgD family transcriptional regulator
MTPAALSSLIGSIYDASLDPERWRDALVGIGSFLGSEYVVLISEDAASAKAHLHYASKDDDEWIEAYYRKYIHTNPILVPPILNVEVGDIFSVSSFMTIREFRRTVFYKEWVRTRGYLDTIAAMLTKSPTAMSVISAVRSEKKGPVDEATRRRMRLLVPHVQRAVTIGRIVDLNTLQAASLADTLDGFAAGIFLADAKGTVVHANVAADTLFAQGDPLRKIGRQLAPVNADAAAAFAEAFAACAQGDAAAGDKTLAIALSDRAGQDYVAHVLPLTSGARRNAGQEYSAVAAVFVREAELRAPLPLQVLAQRFNLTARELSVMLAVVAHGGVPAVSELLGLSETTTKSYLQTVFRKTGASRQADLVKIVAGYANPFVVPAPR